MTAPNQLSFNRFIASGGTAEQLEAVARILATGRVWATDNDALAPIVRAIETKEQCR